MLAICLGRGGGERGFGSAQIKAVYVRAKASKTYDKVERWFGNGRSNTFERAYALTTRWRI